MADKSGFGAFLRAFSLNTGALMSGAPSIPFAALGLYLPSPDAKLLFWILAMVSVALAAFFVWRAERLKVVELETALEKEKLDNTPALVGKIEGVIIGTPNDNEVSCSINISVRNLGAPSIVDRWRMSVTINGIKCHARLIYFESITLEMGNKAITLTRDDAIHEKTATVPIQRGGQQRGWLIGFLSGNPLDVVRTPGNKVEVILEDVQGKSYSAFLVLTRAPTDQFIYQPDGRGINIKNISNGGDAS